MIEREEKLSNSRTLTDKNGRNDGNRHSSLSKHHKGDQFSQWMPRPVVGILIRNRILTNLKICSHKTLINYENQDVEFKGQRPGRQYDQVIKTSFTSDGKK